MYVGGHWFMFWPGQRWLGIITYKGEKSSGDDGSTMALKLIGIVNQIPKQSAEAEKKNLFKKWKQEWLKSCRSFAHFNSDVFRFRVTTY